MWCGMAFPGHPVDAAHVELVGDALRDETTLAAGDAGDEQPLQGAAVILDGFRPCNSAMPAGGAQVAYPRIRYCNPIERLFRVRPACDLACAARDGSEAAWQRVKRHVWRGSERRSSTPRICPTIPVLLARILAVVDGDRSSARDLVDVMQRDQVLAGRVLRLANSGFFGFSRQVATLSRAVMLLGFSSVRSLALGVKVWETLMGQGNASLAALWEHSALVGAAARLIAQRTRTADPEEVFTAGLLHDIGRVVLARKFPAEYAAVMEPAAAAGGSLVERERAVFGVEHTQAGAWLGETWALPKPIVDAAARHHEEITAATPLGTALIVNLANRLVHWTDLEGGAVDPEAERQLESLAAVGLSFAAWRRDRRRAAGPEGRPRAVLRERAVSGVYREALGATSDQYDVLLTHLSADPRRRSLGAPRAVVRGRVRAARGASRRGPRLRARGGPHRPRRRRAHGRRQLRVRRIALRAASSPKPPPFSARSRTTSWTARRLLRWSGEGLGARRRRAGGCRGQRRRAAARGRRRVRRRGAVRRARLDAWDLARQRALELVGEIIDQVVTLAQVRISMTDIQHGLEAELGSSRSLLSDQEETLRAQSDRISGLASALVTLDPGEEPLPGSDVPRAPDPAERDPRLRLDPP